MNIIEKIKENANKFPDRPMIIVKESEKIESITWKQLDDYSDYLASWMNESLSDKKPVIVYGHKNPYMIVCFLACVKSGRAYCPIDVNVPKSRVMDIINAVDPELVLITDSLEITTDKLKVDLEQIKSIINKTKTRISKDSYVSKDDVFYIIFTSGSTGTPKGVQITRDCLDNFIRWAMVYSNCIKYAEKNLVFLNQAPFSFDLSVMDLFLCLYSGGTLWAVTKTVQNNLKELYDSLHESNVNIWVSTPSFADVCLSDPKFDQNLMPFLTDILFCGEILSNKTTSRLLNRFPAANIVNTYGPTESTCAVTEIAITKEINQSYIPLPVGKPKPGTWIRILDENNNQLSDGVCGEIVIVGDSVSIGYWNDDEKNALSFGTTLQDGKEYRYYRTRDEGYIKDGILYYSGRIDTQVKLHGYRIELGDIENNLLKIENVEQAVVIPKYRDGKVASLNAYIVYSEEISDQRILINNIKDYLRMNVPEYMIPKKITFLSEMPMTTNGKIDKRAIGEM